MFEWALLATKIILDGLINGVFSIVSSFTLWSALFPLNFSGLRMRERESERCYIINLFLKTRFYIRCEKKIYEKLYKKILCKFWEFLPIFSLIDI
jgi:hypothetical protein